ncbi:MAG TPA: carboxypeptidase regulatory-like domain-containing protein, partial [Thermoanaerobaculia bacterium]|nr:carboxypeptidase regulatory-like domain-containing protein [Thermoanaerobaculia bacterium]
MLLALFAAALTAVAVPDGEICRFPAGDRDDPFQRWLASQELTCVAAAPAIDFPSGLWNVFARSGGTMSLPMLVDGDHPPAALPFTFEAAATVAPLLPEGRRAVIYLPDRGVAFPVSSPQVDVPANEALWLLVLDRRTPAAVVPIAALEPGSTRTIDGRSGAPPAILGWLRVPEEDRGVLAKSQGLIAPAVTATAGETSRHSDPLPPLDMLHGAFYRIGGVPPGEAAVSIGGRGWIAERRPVEVRDGLSVVSYPLAVRAAGTLIVNWSTQNDLAALERSIGSCDPPEQPRVAISISACPVPPQGERLDPAGCTPVHQQTFDIEEKLGSVTLENVAPGIYRAEMRFGALPPITGTRSVAALEQRDLRLFASYGEIYGSVTYGGEPVIEAVTIEFPGGHGFAPGGSGEYRAALLRPLETDAPITVTACDGVPSATVFVDRPVRRNVRFNIDIPSNALTVAVRDTFTREALEGATVRLTVMSRRFPFRPLLTRTAVTDRNGELSWTSLPEREIHLAVSHAGYESQTVKPFSLWKDEKRTAGVELVPLRGSRGKILSDRPFESGAIFWFSPSGTESERAEVAPDGTFVYGGAHGPDETMVVVSLSHPLWVARAP